MEGRKGICQCRWIAMFNTLTFCCALMSDQGDACVLSCGVNRTEGLIATTIVSQYLGKPLSSSISHRPPPLLRLSCELCAVSRCLTKWRSLLSDALRSCTVRQPRTSSVRIQVVLVYQVLEARQEKWKIYALDLLNMCNVHLTIRNCKKPKKNCS